jgi:phosphate transport system substrate-binding protein
MINRFALKIVAVAALSLSVCSFAQSVNGAGASFPNDIYTKWTSDYYKETGIKINYVSVGSGAGLNQIDAKTIDFGATDMPRTDEDLAKKGQLQFPTVIGGVVPVINLAGVAPGQLRLTGELLANIYLGKIGKWNDPAIKALNPNVNLPDAEITSIRRSDGSGTSFLFTDYLSKVSPEWKEKVGANTAVNWPNIANAAAGKGNDGVAKYINSLPNSIGYVEYVYVKKNKMNFASLKNAAGNFVEPTEAAFKSAASGANWAKTFYQILTNQTEKDAWPITGATFIVMYKSQDKPEVATQVLKFFDWAYRTGDKSADALDFVVMPPAVKEEIRQAWGQIKDTSGKTISYK